MTALFSRFVVPALLLSLACGAEGAAQTQTQSVQDLRLALASAKRQAQVSDTLDAAYELVGIIDEAQRIKATDIIGDATVTLNAVIDRATQSALVASISDAHDVLDQLVDISFFTRASGVSGADQTLQKSLRALFPRLMRDVQTALAAASTAPDRWPVAVMNLSVLGELQAAAVLTMQNDLAGTFAASFDAESARLQLLAQKTADTVMRETLVQDLVEARRNRDEQIADASANNLSSVMAELSRTGQQGDNGQGRQESTDMPNELGTADMTCTEVGVLDQEGNMYANQDQLVRLEEECVLSGRIPSEDRCPTRELFFVCRVSTAPDQERIIYTYRGTPEEKTARETCKGDVLPLSSLSGTPPAFKNAALRRILSCLPIADVDTE